MHLVTKILTVVCCCHMLSAHGLTLEQKVGQLLMVHFRGEEANAEAKTLIQEAYVGGIIYYNWANGLHSREQVKNLSAGLQAMATIPLLIAVDQEGGRVTRLKNGFTGSPGNRVLGEQEDLDHIELIAYVMGKELREVGITMNLAPVVDVSSTAVMGERSFGSDPEKVAACAAAAVRGYHAAGIMTCLKHFPGHGSAEIDSHLDLPVVNKTVAALEQVDLLPFAHLAAQTEAIMTAHIVVPAFDTERCATHAAPLLAYLRDELGFQGVIISDSLVMEAILKHSSVEEAAILALQAGCDMVILGGRQLAGEAEGRELTTADVQRIHRSIVEAVRQGRLDAEKVDLASARILKLKVRSTQAEAPL